MNKNLALELGTFEGLPNSYQSGINTTVAAPRRLVEIISNIYTTLTLVGGIMFLLYFFLGALNWITASGKQDKVEKAKNMMTDAAIGLIIIVVSYPITFIISGILGIDILNPQNLIPLLRPGA